jgi:hypothetical protein
MATHSRLARLQQVLTLSLVAAALAWLAWSLPAHPGRALAGLLLITFGHAIFLGLEFVFMAAVSRRDVPPRPAAAELVRAWWAEALHAPRVFFWRQPFRWRAEPDELGPQVRGRRGVVFVHGFICNRGFWNPWMRRLRGTGHGFAAVNLEPVFGSIDAYVPIVDDAVRRLSAATGVPPLLVCHSMGGLAVRAWLRATRDAQRVHRVVTIGSPHRGTWLARFSSFRNGRQMLWHGDWLAELERDEATRQLPPFTCWYSHCDNIVFPTSTATLPHADNRLVPGPAHVELGFHHEVVEGTLALLREPDGSPVW